MQYTIYALVDPNTGEVRYVGQTDNLKHRIRVHLASKRDTPLTQWLASLRPAQPWVVILETVEQEKVWTGENIRPSTACETKWLKRFRRTVLNRDMRNNSPATWDRLVNK
jgi:hypothetical protein